MGPRDLLFDQERAYGLQQLAAMKRRLGAAGVTRAVAAEEHDADRTEEQRARALRGFRDTFLDSPDRMPEE
jgi:hypothetical protein